MSVTGSTLARRALGRELRRLRTAKGLQQAEAARVAETSPQTIGRIEEGQATRITTFQINALCDHYGATNSERRTVLGLMSEVRTARERGGGWWRAYADAMFASDFDHYLSLEESASRLKAWKVSIIPGLLQTPEYRRAVAWTESPDLPPDVVQMRIEAAIHRQTRLKDPDLHIDVMLWEAVLRDPIGGASVMSDQLEHLARMSELPNVSVRIVPFASPGHLGSYVGSFLILEFPELAQSRLIEPPIVYVEEYAGDLYLERPEEVQRYQDAWREICRVALDPDQSRQRILAAAKEYAE